MSSSCKGQAMVPRSALPIYIVLCRWNAMFADTPSQTEELAKVLSQMKLILQGTPGQFCSNEA